MDKDLKKIVEALIAQGFTVTVSRRAHYIVRKNGMFVTTFTGTGKDYRGMRNAIADARRFGFQWPPKR
jgi:hypothetical protein